MNWNARTRQTHRWLGIIFTATVVVTVVALASGGPEWFSYLPLPPLALLLISGLTLFGLLNAARRRRGAGAAAVQVPGARRLHRWSGIVFVATVLATVVALCLPEPIIWVSYLPLIPLALLLFSGLYLLVQAYTARRRPSLPAPANP